MGNRGLNLSITPRVSTEAAKLRYMIALPKPEQQSSWSVHVALLSNDHTQPILHTTLQKSTSKIHTGPAGSGRTIFCFLLNLVFSSFILCVHGVYFWQLKPTAHALYGRLWVCDRPCTAPVIYKYFQLGNGHTKHGVARPSHSHWY